MLEDCQVSPSSEACLAARLLDDVSRLLGAEFELAGPGFVGSRQAEIDQADGMVGVVGGPARRFR